MRSVAGSGLALSYWHWACGSFGTWQWERSLSGPASPHVRRVCCPRDASAENEPAARLPAAASALYLISALCPLAFSRRSGAITRSPPFSLDRPVPPILQRSASCSRMPNVAMAPIVCRRG